MFDSQGAYCIAMHTRTSIPLSILETPLCCSLGQSLTLTLVGLRVKMDESVDETLSVNIRMGRYGHR